MIKINLLRDPFVQSAAKGGGKTEVMEMAPEPKNTPAPSSTGTRQAPPILGIIFGLLFTGIGGLYYMMLQKDLATAEDLNTQLKADKQKLEPYFKLEQQFREQKESLKKKEDELTKLKKQQQMPVQFLQELGNSIPDNVWFAKVTTKGQSVVILGESLTEDAIYQFRDNLARKTQWFKNVQFPGATRKDKKLEFTLTFDMMNPA